MKKLLLACSLALVTIAAVVPNIGVKSLHNGHLIIEKNNIRYTVLGTQL